jgi:hypothetical protein
MPQPGAVRVNLHFDLVVAGQRRFDDARIDQTELDDVHRDFGVVARTQMDPTPVSRQSSGVAGASLAVARDLGVRPRAIRVGLPAMRTMFP